MQRGKRVKSSLPAQSIESRVARFCEVIEEQLQLKGMRRCLPGMKNTENIVMSNASVNTSHYKK